MNKRKDSSKGKKKQCSFNEEQYNMLCKASSLHDLEIWNRWRSLVGGPILLENADLNNTYLEKANLEGAMLRNAQLSLANLTQARLTQANLEGANLELSNLSQADLSGANLHGAHLGRAKLIRANLAKADLEDAIMEYTYLQGAQLIGIRGVLFLGHITKDNITAITGINFRNYNVSLDADQADRLIHKTQNTTRLLILIGNKLVKNLGYLQLLELYKQKWKYNQEWKSEEKDWCEYLMTTAPSVARYISCKEPELLDRFKNILDKIKTVETKRNNLNTICTEYTVFIKDIFCRALRRGCYNIDETGILSEILLIIISKPGEEEGKNSKDLWLEFKEGELAHDVASAILVLDTLAALIRVFHQETTELPAYVTFLESNSAWHQKEREEEENRIVCKYIDPLRYIGQEERLRIYKVVNESYKFGLGNVPVWVWNKLKALWCIIPEWKRAKAASEKDIADAKKTNEETKTIREKRPVEIEQEWQEVYTMEQDRLLKAVEQRLKMTKEVLDMMPKEYRELSPKAGIALISKIWASLDDAASTNDIGKFLTDEEIKKLPPIVSSEIKSGDTEKL